MHRFGEFGNFTAMIKIDVKRITKLTFGVQLQAAKI